MLRVNVNAGGHVSVEFPLAGGSAGEARPLRTSDVPGVAELFQKTFRKGRKAAAASLLDYIEEIFLNHPWQDDGHTSRVIVDGDGAVTGFIGVLPQRLLFGDRLVRTAVMGSLMSHEPKRNPLVGAKLVRSALNGGQELSFSESANPLSLRMWEKSGGVVLPLYSLSWIRVFRPAMLPVATLAKRLPLAAALAPLTVGIDRLIHRIAPDVFASAPADAHSGKGYDVDADEFAAAVPSLCERYHVRPLWDARMLRWLFEHSALKSHFGQVRMRLVKGRGDRIAGGYITYGSGKGMAFVLQMFAAPNAERLVVDELFAHADAQGFAAMRGRVQPELLDALVRQRAILLRRSAAVVHTRNRELLTPLLGGNALLTGLAAEAWTRLIGDEFS